MYLRKEGYSNGWKSYPWGFICLLCGSSILLNIPDFALHNPCSEGSNTIIVTKDTHQVGKKMGEKDLECTYDI